MTDQADLSPLRQAPIGAAIAKFEELMTQSGPAFLIGAGCSKCAGLPLTLELTSGVLSHNKLKSASAEVLRSVQLAFKGAAGANIEDYLSELIDLISIADRRSAQGATSTETSIEGKNYPVGPLKDAVEDIKAAIADLIGAKVSIDTHRRFVKAVHRPARPGRPGPDLPVDYLVLNYDSLIEDALALERVQYSDGLEGGGTGWWSPASFDRPSLAARVLKLHGSISWVELDGDPLPRRLSGSVQLDEGPAGKIMIWPAATKYRETQRDPYAQLLNRARRTLRPAARMQRVLISCGYRFADTHINEEIHASLRESEGRLTLAVFSSEVVPPPAVLAWANDADLGAQILVFSKNGFRHGTTQVKSQVDLPWWRFDVLTRLLEGER